MLQRLSMEMSESNPLHKMSRKILIKLENSYSAMNGTSEEAGNVTEELGKALNETNEAFSNATGNAI